MNKTQRRTSRCPYCRERILIRENPRIGQYLICSACGEEVEIVRLDPIVLDMVYLPDADGHQIEEYEFWDTYWEGA